MKTVTVCAGHWAGKVEVECGRWRLAPGSMWQEAKDFAFWMAKVGEHVVSHGQCHHCAAQYREMIDEAAKEAMIEAGHLARLEADDGQV